MVDNVSGESYGGGAGQEGVVVEASPIGQSAKESVAERAEGSAVRSMFPTVCQVS